MRLSLTVLGLDLLTLELTTDEDDTSETMRPPFGFAGSGSGITELSDDRMLDNIQGDKA